MTSAEFRALFPEFTSPTYDARIAALLTVLPELDEERAGNQLNFALGNWVADKLALQDYAITFGAGASLGSSTTVEKTVGKLSIKRSSSSSSSSSSGGSGASARLTKYGERWNEYVREFGMGALAI